MIYKKYGECFKTLRKQHGRALSSFEEIGISKGTLSNFENGKTMISLDKLNQALEMLNVTMATYCLIINNGQPNSFISEFKSIENGDINQNRKELERVYKEYICGDSNDEVLIALAAKSHLSSLSSIEIEKIEHCLDHCVFWGLFELNLLVNTMGQLSIECVLNYINVLSEGKHIYINDIREYRALYMKIIVISAFLLIELRREKDAESMLDLLERVPVELEVTARVEHLFLQGTWIYQFEDKKMGNKLIRRATRILIDIGGIKLKNHMEFFYNRIKNGDKKLYLEKSKSKMINIK